MGGRARDRGGERDRARRPGGAPASAALPALPGLSGVRDEEVAALVAAARETEWVRQGLAARLTRLQGQTLDGLLELATEHARAQESLAEEDGRLLAALRRGLG